MRKKLLFVYRIRCHNAELSGLHTHDFELDRTKAAAHEKQVALSHRPVGFQKVRLQVAVIVFLLSYVVFIVFLFLFAHDKSKI